MAIIAISTSLAIADDVLLTSSDTSLPPYSIRIFSNPVRGASREFVDQDEYVAIDIPSQIPSYMMLRRGTMYRTPEESLSSSQYLVPLFTTMPPNDDGFSQFDQFHQITQADQYRPDLISYRYYDTVDYFWVILLANNIIDPFAMTVGTILRIPSAETVITQWVGVQ